MTIKPSIMFFIIVSIGIMIYSNSLGNDFVWDDSGFVIKNDYIKDLKNIPSYFVLKDPLAEGGLADENYRPLLVLSLAIDYFFWKLNPFGYHFTNMIVHILNALLVFWLVFLIARDKTISFLTSLFFLSHPIQTESVSWISGRADVLFLFYYLLALVAYIYYLNNKRILLYFLSLFMFCFSLLSKEMAASLPLVLILFDIYYNNRERLMQRILRYVPYFLMLEVYIIFRFHVIGKFAQCSYWGDSAYRTFLTMSKGLVQYIMMLLFPVNLCGDYLRFPVSFSFTETQVILSITAIVLILLGAVAIAKKERHISFSIFWFFVTLAPAMNIIPIKIIIAERFLYLPSMGYCFILGVLIMHLVNTWKEHPVLRYAGFLLALFIVAIYSSITMARNVDWTDDIMFWKKNAEIYPDNERAHYNLAIAYISRENDMEKAFEEVNIAIEQAPNYSHPRTITASYFIQKEEYEKAIDELKKAIEIDPDFLHAYTFLGGVYSFLKEYDMALKEYNKALAKDPDFILAKLSIANLYVMKGETEKAINKYESLLSEKCLSHCRPYYAAAYLRLGDLYLTVGQRSNAIKAWKKVSDDFKDQTLFCDIAKYLTGEKALDELLAEIESWQPEFKIVGFYHIGFLKEMGGDMFAAKSYYLKAANIATMSPSQLKQLAIRRLSELDEEERDEIKQ